MKKIELIIFDIDGTLVDARRDITDSVNFMLKDLGRGKKSLEQVSSYIGGGVRDLVEKSLGTKEKNAVEKGIEIFSGYYREHFADNSKLYPNVKETLEHFKAKKMAVMTNRKKEFAQKILERMGIDEYFAWIQGADREDCMKPSSCPVDSLKSKFDAPKDRTVLVGDMDIDVNTGKRSGILTCAVTYGIGDKDSLLKARPDFLIDDFGELEGLFE
jgi:phosphoglycolate phosphatase-like HAD superfamily hydrolase